MRIVILFINFFLITLILYSVVNSKIVEGLSGCSGNNTNAVYRQQALTNRLFSEMNTLKMEYNMLNMSKTMNTIGVNFNMMKNRSAVKDINDKKKAKEKELDDLGKAFPAPGAPPPLSGEGGAGKFGNALKSSKSSARF